MDKSEIHNFLAMVRNTLFSIVENFKSISTVQTRGETVTLTVELKNGIFVRLGKHFDKFVGDEWFVIVLPKDGSNMEMRRYFAPLSALADFTKTLDDLLST